MTHVMLRSKKSVTDKKCKNCFLTLNLFYVSAADCTLECRKKRIREVLLVTSAFFKDRNTKITVPITD